jgi:hypothetical protein
MVRLRTIAVPRTLRGELAARYRALEQRYGALHAGCPYGMLADRLEVGEPVVLFGWQLKRHHPDVRANARYRLDGDTVVPIGRRTRW